MYKHIYYLLNGLISHGGKESNHPQPLTRSWWSRISYMHAWMHACIHTYITGNKEIWWNLPIKTANKVEYNRPDVVIWNRETCHLVEISVSLDINISNQQVVKRDKYMPLVSEMQQLYRNYTFQIIPVIIGCLGAIPKSVEQNLKKLGLEDATYKPLIKKLQKTALLGSVKIMKTFIRM